MAEEPTNTPEPQQDAKPQINEQELNTLVQAAIEREVSGLKEKNSQLIKNNKDLKSQLKVWDGIDADSVKRLLGQAAQEEENELLKAGKLDELIEKRTDRLRSQYDEEISSLKTNYDTAAQQAERYQKQFEQRLIDDEIRTQAINQKALPMACDDIIRRARELFSLNEETGEVEARDRSGNLMKNSDGLMVTPERFVEDLKTTAPYYWQQSQGGGLDGATPRTHKGDMEQLEKLVESGNFDLAEFRKIRERQSGKNYHRK